MSRTHAVGPGSDSMSPDAVSVVLGRGQIVDAMSLDRADELKGLGDVALALLVLEYRFRDGRTLVKRFVDLRPELEHDERGMLLGWWYVVQGPFEALRRQGER